MLSAAYYLEALVLAAVAVCYSYVLVQPGMLLAPLQRWFRDKYRWVNASDKPLQFYELDDQWWWKPLWGCFLCVSGQWGLFGFLLLFPLAHYSLFAHLGFTALTIFFAAGWRAFYAWSQTI